LQDSNKKKSKEARINERIRVPEVRLIDEKGGQVGIVATAEALARAKNVSLDLVEVAPDERPPVCKILDFGKMRFEERKKQSLLKKKHKVIDIKELQFRITIEDHDYQVKRRHAERFLSSGAKVRIVLRFKGREMGHQEIGLKLLDRIIADLVEHGSPESQPKTEGKRVMVVLAPLASKPSKLNKVQGSSSHSKSSAVRVSEIPSGDAELPSSDTSLDATSE